VGGAVGTNMPALYQLGGTLAANAHSGTTVLGPVDFDFTTSSVLARSSRCSFGQGQRHRFLAEPGARQRDADRR
jgi:hypothetical protein